jgi:hypothetical protein
MKPFTLYVDIELPRDDVVRLFDSSENMFHWQNGIQSFEHVSGQPGQPGAKSRMIYQQGNQRIELTETITTRDLPDEFCGIYAWDSGRNTLENRFLEWGPGTTRWESTCRYEMDTLLLKLKGFLMPGNLKKQNLKFMNNF